MDLEIWRDAIDLATKLFDLADKLTKKGLYRFAEQLRGSGLSMSNNIAEGSGSSSKREFSNFLNIARRSTFENANVILILEKCGLLGEPEATEILIALDRLSGKLQTFRRLSGASRMRRTFYSMPLAPSSLSSFALHYALRPMRFAR